MRTESHGQTQNALLEPLLASFRYSHSLRLIRRMRSQGIQVEGFDIGCGFSGSFVVQANRLEGVRFHGGDLSVDQKPYLFEFNLSKPTSLPFRPNLITLHAVLEHVDDPAQVVGYIHSILEPGGYFLMTAPANAAKPILEFLSFRLGLISGVEIKDHKQYFNRSSLRRLLQKPTGPFDTVEHSYFQLGLNNLAICQRL